MVLDCSDNFATRHAVNRACVRHAKPLVSGAAIRFDGQIAVFDLRRREAPCYACLFPEGGEIEELRCAVMGVLAPLTGAVGSLQAVEAIKLVAGAGESLSGFGRLPVGVESHRLGGSQGTGVQGRLLFGDLADHERQAARGRQGPDRAEFDVGVFEGGAEQALHLGHRLGQKAGRDFFGADFEKEFLSHQRPPFSSGKPSRSRMATYPSAHRRATLRTRPM